MFYERYMELCKKSKLSPSVVASQAGFHKATVSIWKKKYEAGIDVRPGKDIVEKICAFFDCSESWLLGFEVNKKMPTSDDGGEHTYSDVELTEAFNRADEATRQAIRLLLGLQ